MLTGGFRVGSGTCLRTSHNSDLIFSESSKFTHRDVCLLVAHPLRNGAFLYILRISALFCAFFLPKWPAEKHRFAKNAQKCNKQNACVQYPL